MLKEHHLPVQRTARYYTIGTFSEQTQHIWFCLHGFGQLAQYFGRKFTNLADGKTCIIVPEGLSRLYLDGDYQRVGASWMTREDAPYEIRDYVSYLNALYDLIMADRNPANAEIEVTLFGFSQGAATACRWLNDGHIKANRLILWAGYFPKGLADLISTNALTNTETHYVYGKQDEYISALTDITGYLHRIQADVPHLQITAFDGTHRVEPDVLKTLVSTTKAIP